MTESEILEREKYCDQYDAENEFWQEMNNRYGPDFEAVFSRMFDQHYKTKTTRSMFIRKWDVVTKRAKNRMVSCETTF